MKPKMKKKTTLLILSSLGVSTLFMLPCAMATLPLPHNLISLYSPAGKTLLAKTPYKKAFPVLSKNYVTQFSNFCGIASGVIVLNSLGAGSSQTPFTQKNIFSPAVKKIVSSQAVATRGMSLIELSNVLKSYSLKTVPYYGKNLSISQFRQLLQTNLQLDRHFLIAQYSRKELHQAGSGHFSPIAAYDPHSDRVLIEDVASFHYPPTWVKTNDLWDAMRKDPTHERGVLLAYADPGKTVYPQKLGFFSRLFA